MMGDDGVREVHGVSDGGHWVRVLEVKAAPHVALSCSTSTGTILTALEARYLGLKLLRLARRIKQRDA